MAVAVGIVATLVGLLVATGLWIVWRRHLQLCPHCGWIVRRVQQGWLRCSRCHKQYARHSRLKH